MLSDILLGCGIVVLIVMLVGFGFLKAGKFQNDRSLLKFMIPVMVLCGGFIVASAIV